MWNEVSSSAPHVLHKRLLVSSLKWRCLLRVLCLIRRPKTALDCVLLKDKNLVFVVELGPEISYQACFLSTRCYQILVIHSAFYLSFYVLLRNPQGQPRSYQTLNKTISCKLVGEQQWLSYILMSDNWCTFCWCHMWGPLSLSSCQTRPELKHILIVDQNDLPYQFFYT